MARPVIGVTTSARSGWRIFPLIALSVRLAGGRPVWWRVGQPADLDMVDGVIVGGGDDISADLYGGTLTKEARLDPARDRLEHDIVVAAHDRTMPVLGICRGAQMINITLGGSLHGDIYAQYRKAKRLWTVLPKKTVQTDPDSRLADIVGPDEPMVVNALHTQSVDRVGEGLSVVAHDEYGIVQAIERARPAFMLGVQWHPEHLFYARRQRAIFRALTVAATAYAQGRDQARAVDRDLATI